MSQVLAMLRSFASELPVALLFAHLLCAAPLRRVALAAMLATAMTHPVFWLLNYGPTLAAIDRAPRLVVLECAVIVIEMIVYAGVARVRLRDAVLISVAANGTSLLVGLALAALGVI